MVVVPALIVVVAQLVVFSLVFWLDRDWVIGRSVKRTFDRVCEGGCIECDREESEWKERGRS